MKPRDCHELCDAVVRYAEAQNDPNHGLKVGDAGRVYFAQELPQQRLTHAPDFQVWVAQNSGVASMRP